MRPEAKLSPPAYRPRALERIGPALRSGHWVRGPRVEKLERRIGERLAVDPALVIATSSATAALHAAAHYLGYTENEGARVCPLTWPSTYLQCCRPAWRDLGDTGLDISVDLWGVPARQPGELHDAAHRFGDPSHAALLGNGTYGVVYSFAPQKEVPGWGGGALVVSDSGMAEECRTFLLGGIKDRVWTGVPGIKGTMTDVEAGFLGEQLNRFEERRDIRLELLAEYEKHLGGLLLTKPSEVSGHLCIVKAPSPVVRAHWRRSLDKGGVAWGHHYPMNEAQRLACPNAAYLSDRILTLPLHVEMDKASVRRVCYRLMSA